MVTARHSHVRRYRVHTDYHITLCLVSRAIHVALSRLHTAAAVCLMEFDVFLRPKHVGDDCLS